MLFNSYEFAVLVAACFLIYYTGVVRKYQVHVLIVFSCIFYGYSQPYLLILLFISANTNALCSYLILTNNHPNSRKSIAVAGVLFNLGVLSTFKYGGLISGLFGASTNAESELIQTIVLLPLPIGISFYTFQGISLLCDVYRKEFVLNADAKLENADTADSHTLWKHWKNTLLYIMYFPQLIAGPIVKARDFYPQIVPKYMADIHCYKYTKALILGYFLKVVIADNLKDQTFWIADPYFTYQSSLTLIVMMVGYSFQIFSDFAGYSLIAIGIAGLFGYELPKNFNFPYISRSVTEFWRRWHISLSSWLRDYLYIGLLGGNRHGSLRTYLNLLVVMFLGGLWHGAALSYGIWGLWHGMGLLIERAFLDLSSGRAENNIRSKSRLTQLILNSIKLVLVFIFVTIGWIFFKLNELEDVIAFVNALIQNGGLSHHKIVLMNVFLFSMPIILYHLMYLARQSSAVAERCYIAVEPALYALLLFFIITNSGIPGEFVYFQF